MNEFDHPVVAGLYDPLDPDRSDLDPYLGIAADLGARSVLDVGAGTGVLALLLAEGGVEVTAVEPAGEMLAVARAKPGAAAVRWIHGDATILADLNADLATMTANTAQVFTTDAAWHATLAGIHGALRPGGALAFESRVPDRRAWQGWVRARTGTVTDVPGTGAVESWVDVDHVDLPLVTFRNVIRMPDGSRTEAVSTLRFRERDELEESLTEAGFAVVDVRDLAYRPGDGWVFVARKITDSSAHAVDFQED